MTKKWACFSEGNFEKEKLCDRFEQKLSLF